MNKKIATPQGSQNETLEGPQINTGTAGLPASNIITASIIRGEYRVDTRLVAAHLENDHSHVFEMIRQYQDDFSSLGLVRFETEAVKTATSRGAKIHRYALLNEDQSYLLLSYSRNTPRARRAHEAGSVAGEEVFHCNVNKLANKVCGIQPGERRSLSPTRRATLTATQEVIRASLNRSMVAGEDHRAAYRAAKANAKEYAAMAARLLGGA